MHPLVLIPLLACVICSAYCLVTTPARYDSRSSRTHWLAKALHACAAVWAFCEVSWNIAPNAIEAERFLPLAEMAIVLIGPIAVDLALSMAPHRYTRIRRRIVWLYGLACALIMTTWTTQWFIAGLTPVAWGHSTVPGPLFPIYYCFVAGCGVFGLIACRRIMREALDLNSGLSGKGIVLAILALLIVASLTDSLLPMLGIQVPRLTTASFAVLASVSLWSMSRPQGYVFASQAMISREILRVLHEGVVFVTLEGRVLLANEEMGNFVGCTADELVGRSFQRHLPELALDQPQERVDVETQLIAHGGTSIIVATSISTVRDDRGQPMGLVVVLRDLRELKLLRGRLITSGRLAAVGQLAAGIAHEINNPIAFVRTNLAVLRDHWSAVEKALEQRDLDDSMAEILHEGEEIIDESIDGVDRAARIVRDVREFSQAGAPERELVELAPLLDRVARVAAPELGPGIQIERNYAQIPEVPASPQQLKQVFLNLLLNAVHAVDGQGTICISTSHEGDEVIVRIADDGCGIPPEMADRIFDPFFTTKPVGKGTGLGLSISHEIIRTHGGEIDVEPREGDGICFCVRLPLVYPSEEEGSHDA